MPYTLSYIESDSYLVCHHQGNVGASELRAARDDARRLASESGERKLLIDYREVSVMPDVGDCYFVVHESAANKLTGAKTAVLARAEHSKITDFIAFTATTAGLTVKAFQNEAEALQWLCRRQ